MVGDECQPQFFGLRNLENRDKKLGWMAVTFLKFTMIQNFRLFVGMCLLGEPGGSLTCFP